ncbi:integrase core domain protein [Bifidobacterium saguini DSM 23967]|uniref:Integrase core domain protein n=1 Tax=Bifidobacterium saguini DSM 23967 TaxID=1437607 RepID=A0A087D7N7_9BIFI|nr:integrase core domain protein [Bifidobacterium saguini DSM 23967]
MKVRGMTSSYSKAAYRPHPSRPNDDPAPNLLAREFNGYRPRTHLASDLTYVRVGNSWAYIRLLIDLANREIAGHSVGIKHDLCFVKLGWAVLAFLLVRLSGWF